MFFRDINGLFLQHLCLQKYFRLQIHQTLKNELFINLFTNAVKYSSEEKGNITIDAKKEKMMLLFLLKTMAWV